MPTTSRAKPQFGPMATSTKGTQIGEHVARRRNILGDAHKWLQGPPSPGSPTGRRRRRHWGIEGPSTSPRRPPNKRLAASVRAMVAACHTPSVVGATCPRTGGSRPPRGRAEIWPRRQKDGRQNAHKRDQCRGQHSPARRPRASARDRRAPQKKAAAGARWLIFRHGSLPQRLLAIPPFLAWQASNREAFFGAKISYIRGAGFVRLWR